MEITKGINRPLSDEHVIASDPPLRPELPDEWRRRINPFGGRSISDKALTAEQDVRAGMARMASLGSAPGVIDGLHVSPAPGALGETPDKAQLDIAAGMALAHSGEDISVGAPRRIKLADIPVVMRADHADILAGGEDEIPLVGGSDDAIAADEESRLRPVLPRKMTSRLGSIAKNKKAKNLPRAAILIAQPVSVEILGRPVDDCPLDPRDDPYLDMQRIDGCRLLLYVWPSEVSALDGGPDYNWPGGGEALRNKLAYAIFDNEKLQGEDDQHPWDAWGVPLALVGFDQHWQLEFVDVAAAARKGGADRKQSAMVPYTGDVRLWQARIDQFVRHLADLHADDEELLRQSFERLPPAGLLPKERFDPVLRRQDFFPQGFKVSAAPIPMSNLEPAILETASLSSMKRGTPDAVEMLVPVPDEMYEPGLLQTELLDPEFARSIMRFRQDRKQWLIRREAARRRYDRLVESVSGVVNGWPKTDLPIEENSPFPRVQVPVELTRTRRINARNQLAAQRLLGAHATLPVQPSDTIWFWLRVHESAQLKGISLRVGAGTKAGNDKGLAKGVFWGNPGGMMIAKMGSNIAKQKAGDLPEEGGWTLMEIPASDVWSPDGKGLDGFALNGLEFEQMGGDIEWGSFGKTDAKGLRYTYLADDTPAGSTLTVTGAEKKTWPFETVDGRKKINVPDFGTVSENGVRRAGAIDSFRNDWTQDFLAADMAEIDEGGIDAFLASVDSRLKETNDAIDLGFVRARSDIYRVRQIMLGADAASRLVTSPSLADLSKRDEGARATSKGISEFLKASTTKKATDTIFSVSRARNTRSSDAVMAKAFVPKTMTLNIASMASASKVTAKAPPPPPPPPTTFPIKLVNFAAVSPLAMKMATTQKTKGVGSKRKRPRKRRRGKRPTSLRAHRISRETSRYNPSDIRAQLPIAGLVERTISVAERLTPPPAVQALTYAIASKAAVVDTLARLSKLRSGSPIGVYIADIPVAGFHLKSTPDGKEGAPPTVQQLLADRKKAAAQQQYEDADDIPGEVGSATGKHESDYFTAAVKAIDNSIAIMRAVEGRVALFEKLAASLEGLKKNLLNSANEAARFLREVDVEVEEARHDLSTAERLRDEEQQRVDALNLKRASILEDHVPLIAWRRPRQAAHLQELPQAEIASGLQESPIVSCRKDHPDVPEEVEDYLELMREVPVKWFPQLQREVERVKRLDNIRKALYTVQQRALYPRAFPALRNIAKQHRLRYAAQQAMVSQQRRIQARRSSVAMFNFAAVAQLSLAQAHLQYREIATLGDLLTGTHRRRRLTARATELYEGISAIAACMHESFGEVKPIIRLGWAEILSEYDDPAPLRELAGLPRWAEVPMEQRRALQGFVDWLYARIDEDNNEAAEAINELIRICILLAAEAPVDQIIPARLVKPVPARIGGRLQLALDITRVRRGMTALIRDRRDRIVSRAVVDDVREGYADVTIKSFSRRITTISPEMRFQLVGGNR